MILSMKNKYIIRSRISQKKFREILKYFAQDIEATKIAKAQDKLKVSKGAFNYDFTDEKQIHSPFPNFREEIS